VSSKTADDELRASLAKQIDWTPLPAGTSNFRMMRLRDLGADGLVYRPTTGGLMFLGGLAFVMNAVGIIACLVAADEEPEIAFVGVPFLAIGLLLAYLLVRSFTKAPYFNARARRLERSGGPGESAVASGRDAVPFEAMHALQIIQYYVPGDSDSRGYDVVQLNLVTHDGKRVHVTSSPDSCSLEAEAATIARLLHVPVWRNS
jgi:hypothetical protein